MGRHHCHTDRRSPSLAAVALTAVVVASACSGSDDDSAAFDTAEEATFDMAEAGDDEDAGDEAQAEDGRAIASERGDVDLGTIGRDVIVEMRVVLASDDIERTVASVTAAASTLGGGIASSDVDYGESADRDGTEPNDRGYAVLVVKVPPDSVDRLLDGLDDTGTVQSINQSARDVTEQLVDLDVRIANARRSVTSVREFMDRTENLTELVSLEAELTQRQTDLERLEAQQRTLSDRVALATITVEVVPTASVPAPVADEDRGIADAFESGWQAFVAVLFGLAFVVAATSPFLVAAAVIALGAWLWIRRRDRDRASVATGGSAATDVAGDAPHAPVDVDEPVG